MLMLVRSALSVCVLTLMLCNADSAAVAAKKGAKTIQEKRKKRLTIQMCEEAIPQLMQLTSSPRAAGKGIICVVVLTCSLRAY